MEGAAYETGNKSYYSCKAAFFADDESPAILYSLFKDKSGADVTRSVAYKLADGLVVAIEISQVTTN